MGADPLSWLLSGVADEAGRNIDAQVAAIERLGWHAVEIRTVEGQSLAALDRGRFRTLQRKLKAREWTVTCVASSIGNWGRPITADLDQDLDELRRLADRAHLLGVRMVRVMSWPNDGLTQAEWGCRARDRMAVLVALASSLGLYLVHENCVGWGAQSPVCSLQLLEHVGDAFGLLFDTGNPVVHGQSTVRELESLLVHIAHVHIKDVVSGTAGGHAYCLPGSGSADVTDSLGLLASKGYSGALSLEPHLAFVPHRGSFDEDTAAETFHAAGRALERVVAELALRGGAT